MFVFENAILVMAAPLQMFGCVAGVSTNNGVGSTTTSAVTVNDGQPDAEAVKVKVTVCTEAVLLANVPVIVAPVPEAATPVTLTVLFLVQLYDTPATLFGFEAVMVPKGNPPHTVCVLGTTESVGCGLTVMVNILVLLQPLASAVTVKVVVWTVLVLLVSAPEMLVPLPDEGSPVRLVSLSRVQANVAPGTLLAVDRLTVVKFVPEHTVCAAGTATGIGIGFTMTSTVMGSDTQLSSETALIVKVVVCGVPRLWVKFPEMILPVPEAGTPVIVAVLFLVHENEVTPATPFGLLMTIGEIASPAQIDCVAGVAATFGLGCTLTLMMKVVPTQLPEVAVTLYVAVCTVLVGLMSVWLNDTCPVSAVQPVKPPVTDGAPQA